MQGRFQRHAGGSSAACYPDATRDAAVEAVRPRASPPQDLHHADPRPPDTVRCIPSPLSLLLAAPLACKFNHRTGMLPLIHPPTRAHDKHPHTHWHHWAQDPETLALMDPLADHPPECQSLPWGARFCYVRVNRANEAAGLLRRFGSNWGARHDLLLLGVGLWHKVRARVRV